MQGPSTERSRCAHEWARQSDVPLRISGIHLMLISKSLDARNPLSGQSVICVAVGAEPVEGRTLPTWEPTTSGGTSS